MKGYSLGFILALLLLVVVSINSVLVLLHPWWLEYEYKQAHFPPDIDFDNNERLDLGNMGLAYVAGSDFDLSSVITKSSLQFSHLEVAHLTDVKKVINVTKLVWLISLVSLGLAWGYCHVTAHMPTFVTGVRTSSLVGLAVIGLLGLSALVMWEQWFTSFHLVLFPQGNWAFPAESLLIRLYPPRFWQDSLVFVVISSLVQLALLAFVSTRYIKTKYQTRVQV